MTLVKQPIDVAALPAERKPQIAAETIHEGLDGSQPDAIQMPALDQGNEILAHSGCPTQIFLSKTLLDAEHPHRSTKPCVVHLAILARRDWFPIIRPSLARLRI